MTTFRFETHLRPYL